MISSVPGEGIEPPTNGLQNRCSTAELTRHSETFCTSLLKLPPDCHHCHRVLLLFCAQRIECPFHDSSSFAVLALDQMAVHRQCDRRRAVSKPTRDSQNIHAAGDQLRSMGMANGIQQEPPWKLVRRQIDIHLQGAERAWQKQREQNPDADAQASEAIDDELEEFMNRGIRSN
jgi:hypothetical protein